MAGRLAARRKKGKTPANSQVRRARGGLRGGAVCTAVHETPVTDCRCLTRPADPAYIRRRRAAFAPAAAISLESTSMEHAC
jgi:hypothetical protein